MITAVAHVDAGRPPAPLGLLVRDTRVVSCWSLTIDGRAAEPLAVQQAHAYAAAFKGRLRPPHDARSDAAMLIRRHRSIGDGTREEISIRSTVPLTATLAVMVTAAADLADLFAVKAGGSRLAAASVAARDSALTFIACQGDRGHGLLIRADGSLEAAHRALSRGGAVSSRGPWLITVQAVPARDGSPMTLHHPRGRPVEHARAASGVPRGDGGPSRAANTPPGHGQPRGGS